MRPWSGPRCAIARQRLHELERREQDLTRATRDVHRKADYLRHVVEEIERAAPRNGELEPWTSKQSGSRTRTSWAACRASSGKRSTPPAWRARPAVRRPYAARCFSGKWQELLDGAFAHVTELAQAARDYAAAIESDPQRLGAVSSGATCCSALHRIRPRTPDVLATRDRAARELELLDTADLDLRTIVEQRETAAADFARACRRSVRNGSRRRAVGEGR